MSAPYLFAPIEQADGPDACPNQATEAVYRLDGFIHKTYRNGERAESRRGGPGVNCSAWTELPTGKQGFRRSTAQADSKNSIPLLKETISIMKKQNQYPLNDMITKIQRPKAAKKSGSPMLLASIPKKEGESPEDFAMRFLEKLADLPTEPNKNQ